ADSAAPADDDADPAAALADDASRTTCATSAASSSAVRPDDSRAARTTDARDWLGSSVTRIGAWSSTPAACQIRTAGPGAHWTDTEPAGVRVAGERCGRIAPAPCGRSSRACTHTAVT